MSSPYDVANALRMMKLHQSLGYGNTPPDNNQPDLQSPGPVNPNLPQNPNIATPDNLTQDTNLYRQRLMNYPKQEEFKPSTGRKIGGVLASILRVDPTGNTYDYITQAPFRKQQNIYARDVGAAGELVKSDISELKAKAESGDKDAQAALRKVQEKKETAQADEASAKAELARAKIPHLGDKKETGLKPVQYEQSDGTLSYGSLHTDGSVRDNNGVLVKPEAIKPGSIKPVISAEPKPNLDASKLAVQKVANDKYDGDVSAIPLEELMSIKSQVAQATETPALKSSRQAVTAGNIAATPGKAAESASKVAETAPQSVDFYVNQLKNNPRLIHDQDFIPKIIRPQVEQAYAAQGGKIPRKLSSKELQDEEDSNKSIIQAKIVEDLLNDPEVQQNFGPIAGRLGKLGQYIGDEPFNRLTPSAKEKGARLRYAITSLLFREGRQHISGVVRSNLLKILQEVSPNVNMALPYMKGAIDAVKAGANVNKQAINQSEYGQSEEKKVPKWKGYLK
jgi:hypothetical protein